MTAKEKAKELVDKFTTFSLSNKEDVCITFHTNEKEVAKKCALICVEEILEANPTLIDFDDTPKGRNEWYINNINYWKEVKNQIQLL